ncbi:MAG: glutamate synthase-related protein, partial [Myxococcales bacterium]
MKARGEGPDFITIDGGEGGTGAAPLTFADHVALPFKIGFARVYQVFQREGLSRDVTWIGSGKLGFPDRAVVALAMGCDLINVARESMIAIGCIQAQQCHTDHCPAGIATHNKWLQSGLNVEDKAKRLARYVQGFRKELLSLSHAAGYQHPCQFTGDDIEICTGPNRFTPLTEVLGYRRDPVGFTAMLDYEKTA